MKCELIQVILQFHMDILPTCNLGGVVGLYTIVYSLFNFSIIDVIILEEITHKRHTL